MSKVSYSGKLVREFLGLARQTRSYWIVPLIIFLGIVGFLIASSQVIAPYLYTLF